MAGGLTAGEAVVFATRSRSGRALEPGRVARAAAAAGLASRIAPDVGSACRDALAHAGPEGLALLTGSLFAVGEAMEAFGGIFFSPQTVLNLIPNLRLMLFGALIIGFLIVEPEGLNRLWRNIRSYFRVWPFAY